MKQFALALDLKNDPHLIAEYEAHHQAVWPEILASIKASGILDCSIYRPRCTNNAAHTCRTEQVRRVGIHRCNGNGAAQLPI